MPPLPRGLTGIRLQELDPEYAISPTYMNDKMENNRLLYIHESLQFWWPRLVHNLPLTMLRSFHILFTYHLHTSPELKASWWGILLRDFSCVYTIWQGWLAPIDHHDCFISIPIDRHLYLVGTQLETNRTAYTYISWLPPSPLLPQNRETEERDKKKKKKFVLACNSIRAKSISFYSNHSVSSSSSTSSTMISMWHFYSFSFRLLLDKKLSIGRLSVDSLFSLNLLLLLLVCFDLDARCFLDFIEEALALSKRVFLYILIYTLMFSSIDYCQFNLSQHRKICIFRFCF